MNNDILYDCYDENVKSLGIVFAKDCKDLLVKQPKVKYVLGMDYLTRERVWHRVEKNGLWVVSEEKIKTAKHHGKDNAE